MINFYSGTPGSGKSCHMADDMIWWLNFGKPCIGTVSINEGCLRKKHGKYSYVSIYELDPNNLVKFSKRYFKNRPMKENQILLVIDECHRIFNPRDWNNKSRNNWLTFFAEHRHLGYKIILVAQNNRQIDRQIRCQIEYEYVHRKVNNFGAVGFFLSLFAGGTLFVYVKIWAPMKEKVGSEFFRGRKKLYNFYNTFEMFQ